MSIQSAERLKLANRSRILQATTKLLAEPGRAMDQLTYHDIAKEAGVSKRTISNIFFTKNNLLILTLTNLLLQSVQGLRDYMATGAFDSLCGLEQVLALQKMRADYIFCHPNTFKLINYVEGMVFAQEEERQNCDLYLAATRSIGELFAGGVAKGCADGSIRADIDRAETETMLFFLFGAAAQRLVVLRDNPYLASQIDTEQVIGSMLRGLKIYLAG